MSKYKMGLFALLALVLLVSLSSPASAATATLTGQYTIGTGTGSFSYYALRGIRYGSEGNFVLSGKTYPGSMFTPPRIPGMLSMAWYNPSTYNQVGAAAVTLQPDGSYTGTLTLYFPDGTVKATGTLTVRLQ